MSERRATGARVGLLGLLFAAVAILSFPHSTHAKKLRVIKPTQAQQRAALAERAPAEDELDKPFADRRQILHIGEEPQSVFERREVRRIPAARSSGPDTLVVRVAAIRIEFENDRLGSLTTGNGRMLRENPDPDNIFIDGAPHNEAYFQAHLEALSRYWSSMMYGCIRVEGDVFPRGEEFGSYMLPDMADYGPMSDDEVISIDGLISYSQESLLAADEDPDLVWSDYDVLFVMHAGSDWQNDVLRDSPFDLPTFSITFSDSDRVVTDTGDTLTTMITFPESSSQDGFLVAINGAIAHEFGHQLGLFDIYNVNTFASTVAFYDLMDSGNLASVFIPHPVTSEPTQVIGVLPTALGAWSRWLVSFRFGINPTVIRSTDPRVRLRAIQSRIGESALPPDTYKWIQLPISETEYFMVENRVDDLDGRDGAGNFLTALDQDDDTGVVLGPIHFDTDEISHNYDLLIDPGVLIWHVDERQALANLSRGTGLNTIFEKRAITIEEADGLVDIGNPFSLFPLGTANEAFHADNNANFTPFTTPNSNTNLGPPSNISITNISARDSTVSMNVTFGSKPAGWPMEVGRYNTSGFTATTVADVDGDGRMEIAAVADSNTFVLEYEDGDGDGVVDSPGVWPQPAVGARFLGEPAYTQSIGDLDADGTLEIIATTDSGSVHVWNHDGSPYGTADANGVAIAFDPTAGVSWSPSPQDLDRDGVDELFLTTLDGKLQGYDFSGGSPSLLFDRTLVADVDTLYTTLAFGDLNADGTVDGLVAYEIGDTVFTQEFDAEGRRLTRKPYVLGEAGQDRERVFVGMADLVRAPGDNSLEIVLITETGHVAVVNRDGQVQPGWPITVRAPVAGPPAFADIDRDGLLEIVLTSGGHDLHVLNYNGTYVPGWPVFAELGDFPGFGAPPSGPAIADVDGDGRQDVVVGFVDFTVRAFSPEGELVEGFPFITGAAVRSTPVVIDGNDDGRLDLFVQANDGHVYAKMLAGVASATNPVWPMYGGDARLSGSFNEARLPLDIANGSSLLQGQVTVFPSPVTDVHDEVTVRYTLGGASEGATGVKIVLYNVAGEIVLEMDGPASPNTENVVRIPSSSLASGAYFCSVRARSGGRTEDHLGKFAVIR